MAESIERFIPFLGLYVAGDLGPLTIYTNKRGKIVWYPRSPPKEPPTSAQLLQRQRFAYAQHLWSTQSKQVKADWETAMKRMALDMTGQNAFMSISLRNDHDAVARINHRTGLNLTNPTFTPLAPGGSP
jgi:hypothetical protein